jgi:phosphoserine phosphatase RsbU/P
VIAALGLGTKLGARLSTTLNILCLPGCLPGSPIPSPVRFLDLTPDPSIPVLVDMLRSLTQAGSSRDVLTQFMARYSRVRPIDHFIGLVEPTPDEASATNAPLEDRPFRLMYSTPAEVVRSGRGTHDRDVTPERLRRLPIRRGGFISKMLEEPTPRMVLGNELAEMRSCMVLPIFSGDRVFEWSFAFSRLNAGFQTIHVSQGLMVSNLLGMANRSIDSFAEIKRLHDRLDTQMAQVAAVQRALLPRELPDFPGFEIAASYLTSDQTGGDYYDFKPLPGGLWAGLIADVSGHGAAAATVMAMLRTVVHTYDDPELTGEEDSVAQDPARFVRFVNRQLVEANIEGSFVTALFWIANPFTGEITYLSCGHPPARIRRADGTIEPMHGDGSIPLGILDPIDTVISTATLHLGDTLVFYTDGISESFSPSRDMYGFNRLDHAIAAGSGTPAEVIQRILSSVREHRGASTRDDDQTLLAIQLHGLCAVPRS